MTGCYFEMAISLTIKSHECKPHGDPDYCFFLLNRFNFFIAFFHLLRLLVGVPSEMMVAVVRLPSAGETSAGAMSATVIRSFPAGGTSGAMLATVVWLFSAGGVPGTMLVTVARSLSSGKAPGTGGA